MPLGTRQNNDFTQFTMDVWNDKIFYQEKDFPAGFMAASVLNIPEEKLPELIQAGGAPTFLFPVVVQGSDEEAAAVFPQLRERILWSPFGLVNSTITHVTIAFIPFYSLVQYVL